MKNMIAALLGVIAAGVMVIAFELMPSALDGARADREALERSRTAPTAMDLNGQAIGLARPVNMPVVPGPDQFGYAPAYGAANGGVRPVPIGYQTYDAPVRRSSYQPVSYAPRHTSTQRIEQPRRDWTKTALVIGGTTAAGAGLGAMFGGKKGALIGAALGGGGGTLYEVTKGR